MKKINFLFFIIIIVFSIIWGMNFVVEAEEEIKIEDINLDEYFDSIEEDESIDETLNENDKEKNEEKTKKQNNTNTKNKKELVNKATINSKIFFGITYNNFDTTMTLVGEKWAEHKKEFQNGKGFYSGIKYEYNDRVGIKGGMEFIDQKINDLKVNLFAPYGEISLSYLDDLIELNAGIGKYSYDYMKIEVYQSIYTGLTRDITYIYSGDGIGYLFGGSLNIPFTYNSYLKLGGKYRILDINVDRIGDEKASGLQIDMSGFRFNLGVCRYF